MKNACFSKSEYGIFATYNVIITSYSDNTKKIVYHSYKSVKGIQRDNKKKSRGHCSEEEKNRYKYLNLLRTKQTIIDYAKENSCINPWDYFVTLTFDKNVIGDRNDYNICCNYLKKWINNQKHQNPYMEYLFVIEKHKLGGFHFHGIVKNALNWKLSKSINPHTGKPIKKNGSQIYNLDNYKLGFTTISKIKNQDAVSVYISKYITKELIDIKNKKRYWCSKSLRLPKLEYYETDLNELKDYISNYNLTYEKIEDNENYITAYYSLKNS